MARVQQIAHRLIDGLDDRSDAAVPEDGIDQSTEIPSARAA